MDFSIIIPARYESSRFPGKPLADILGKSLILRVWEQCIKALDKKNVFIATDDERIVNHCLKNDMQYLLTPNTCLTGTDRIYEASKQIKSDIYINVQGDEPLLKPQDIIDVINASKNNPSSIINAMCPISSEEDFRSSSVPKVVTDTKNKLLYMSRGAIPTNKKFEFIEAKKQVCVYALPLSALEAFGKHATKTPMESIEDIEILRFIEMGYPVQMIDVSSSSIAVDHPHDIQRVIEALSAKN